MSVALAANANRVTPLPTTPSPFPTAAALRLEQMSASELEQTFRRGAQPDLEGLVGWEFRGINRLPLNAPVAKLVGIKKFLKGFFRAEDGRVMGYNSPVENNILDGRWTRRVQAVRVLRGLPRRRDLA